MPEKWQYKTVSITPTQQAQLDEILNSYGDAGWELVSIVVEGWKPLGFLGGAQQPATARYSRPAPDREPGPVSVSASAARRAS